MRAHVERKRRERQQCEEAKVIQQRGDCDAEQAAVAQRAERVGQCGGALGARCGRQQEHGDDECERHQRRHPEERSAPRNGAQNTADQRPDRDAEA